MTQTVEELIERLGMIADGRTLTRKEWLATIKGAQDALAAEKARAEAAEASAAELRKERDTARQALGQLRARLAKEAREAKS
ncbi:MAG: hypothetical protein KGL39_56140 [Patescibacteria group bacterium]|nr:hypothetical protein [Patescibacteria group bacterium]